MPEIDDILDGINAELEDTPEFLEFRIENCIRDGEIWQVTIDSTQTFHSEGLDESLEGAAAWWSSPSKGGADVLSVISENQQINLRFATTPPPGQGEKIRIYPPLYLEALLSCWRDDTWANRCIAWLEQFQQNNTKDNAQIPSAGSFPWLRKRQAEAFNLLSWKAGFLWGPPGTGKTTTLGAMLAQYLTEFPNVRVLLLSTTNSAVDLALLAVDKALEQLVQQSATAATVRKRSFRIGNHFIASNYKNREHLLPVKDSKLIRQLVELEARRPDQEHIQAYAQWKQQIESVRLQIRKQSTDVLKNARLAAMTTTRAVFSLADLRALSSYNLIVFDEASQVGLAHALALVPLAQHTLFAGDPKQLSAIVRSAHPSAQQYLGKSMFSCMEESSGSTCLLNEQSRMAQPICEIISNIFYQGKLLVASDCKSHAGWNAERAFASVPPLGSKNVYLHTIGEDGTWSQKYHGPIRYKSAEFIRDLVITLAEHEPADILVLTPFRAQRVLLRSFLRNAGHRQVAVSTVHRAQGSERHTIIFDPAQGNSKFLKGKEASRLINVALSRAKARLVIILSPGDRHNPLLDQIANVIENSGLAHTAIPICNLVFHPQFPDCALGMVIQIRNDIGRLVAIDGTGNRFTLIDFRTGEKRKYITSAMLGVVLKAKAQEVLAGRASWSGQERSAARRLVGDEQHQFGDLRLARRLLELA